MSKIIKYVMLDILQNKMMIAYTLFLLLVSGVVLSLDSDSGKAMLSLLNVVLIVVPLISVVFTTIHYYNSYEFMELLLAQPIDRRRLLISEFAGISLSLMAAFAVGVGVPVLVLAPTGTSLLLVGVGLILTLVFVSMAFFASVFTRDKVKGIGVALMIWFYFSLIYDGIVLFFMFSFSDYPLEKTVLLLTALNPIDLGRIMLMMKLDISALLGFTGALYQGFFGSATGAFFGLSILFLWAALPLLAAIRRFRRKDL